MYYDREFKSGILQRYSFDQAYIHRLRECDPDTQRHFVRYFGELLSIKLRSRLCAPHLAEDVRQETFLRVLAVVYRQGIENPEGLGAFVNSVCNNVLMELYRSEGRHPNLTEDTPEPADQHANPESLAVNNQRKQLVRRVLDELGPKDKELMRQVFLEERSRDEVCREFHIDREYLRVMLHRAKARFREILEKEHGSGRE
jgi:RNA polymerase sigma-70 factor (ECF subfamily)